MLSLPTFPFYENHWFVTKLSSDEVISRLTRKLDELEPEDKHFFKGKTNALRFKFHMITPAYSRNSFNPIFFGEVIPGEGRETIVNIKMRIAYPIYLLWLIIFLGVVFGHVTLTIGAFQSNGILGVLFATVISALFYGMLYFFYRFGFKRITRKTMEFLVPYLTLKPKR